MKNTGEQLNGIDVIIKNKRSNIMETEILLSGIVGVVVGSFITSIAQFIINFINNRKSNKRSEFENLGKAFKFLDEQLKYVKEIQKWQIEYLNGKQEKQEAILPIEWSRHQEELLDAEKFSNQDYSSDIFISINYSKEIKHSFLEVYLNSIERLIHEKPRELSELTDQNPLEYGKVRDEYNNMFSAFETHTKELKKQIKNRLQKISL